ncbi:MAG: GGDEF domain-containing protein [Candidatus Zixiibacteriota bacterium]
MRNTESIILENWPEVKQRERRPRQVYHFAIKQFGVNLDFHLRQYYRSDSISIHFFHDFSSLVVLSQRFPVTAILIGGKGELLPDIHLVQAIKANVFLSIIPVILYHPDPPVGDIVAAFENGAEEFIHGEWVDRLVEVRIRRVIERNRRDVSVNPSTQLPGTAIIEAELKRQLDMKCPIAICYADLDNFKAYNDYYGYYNGDKVVKLTARIIKDCVFDLCREGFVGHIAGDDFLFIIPSDLVDTVCSRLIKTFDSIIQYRYDEDDRDRGFITTKNRKGVVEDYPILTISIAVIINDNGKFAHIGELSKMMADLKKAAKMKAGSNFMVERRSKY